MNYDSGEVWGQTSWEAPRAEPPVETLTFRVSGGHVCRLVGDQWLRVGPAPTGAVEGTTEVVTLRRGRAPGLDLDALLVRTDDELLASVDPRDLLAGGRQA